MGEKEVHVLGRWKGQKEIPAKAIDLAREDGA
jgi:hypothetical protein